jgi:hypothetical protein
MKKQFLMKAIFGVSIMLGGALVPLSSVQAADELSDRYLNGYLNDPYSNEGVTAINSVGPHGAEGPARSKARSDARVADELSDRYLNGYLNDPYSNEGATAINRVGPRGTEGG